MQELKIPASDRESDQTDQLNPLSNCQQNGFSHPPKQVHFVLQESLNASKSALEDQKSPCPSKPLKNDEVNNKDNQIKI